MVQPNMAYHNYMNITHPKFSTLGRIMEQDVFMIWPFGTMEHSEALESDVPLFVAWSYLG